MGQAFECLAQGMFQQGLAKLRMDSAWADDDESLRGPFYLGFPRKSGWGEGLFLASLLKRHAAGRHPPVRVYAVEQVCSIIRDDPVFDPVPLTSHDSPFCGAEDDDWASPEARKRGARPPLALLSCALEGSLLRRAFVELATGTEGENRPDRAGARIGVVWSSVDKGKPICEKTIPFAEFRKLLTGLDAEIVSFQRCPDSTDAKGRIPPDWTQVGTACLDARDQTEALREIAAIDLMVTVSTTTAHIAACLGKPTVLMAAERKGPQWFWQTQERHGRCFYPTVEVVIGHRDKDRWWAPCIARGREKVEGVLGSPRSP